MNQRNIFIIFKTALIVALFFLGFLSVKYTFADGLNNPYQRNPVGHSGNVNPFVPNPDCTWKHISQDCDGEEKDSVSEQQPEVVCRNNKDC